MILHPATVTGIELQRNGVRVVSNVGAFLNGRPISYPTAELANEHASRVIGVAGRCLPQTAAANVESLGVDWRPLPLDGLPIIGHPRAVPSIYLAAMHSGVTLVPIIGHFAAMAILDGVCVDLLADFRVERL